MKYPEPILFFHCVDDRNRNAQSNNTKAILSNWDAAGPSAAAFHFDTPETAVAENPNVRLIKLPPNRLWKAQALMAALGRFSAVVFPGFAPSFDDRVRRLRAALGRHGAIISTLEGMPASSEGFADEEARLSDMAGHPVFCQTVDPSNMAALNRTKAHSDLIVAISPFLANVATQIWPGPQTTYIPLGVNLQVFHPEGRKKHSEKRQVNVVCAGSFQARKRPEVFLELARRHQQAQFTWFGDGQMRGPLLEQARSEMLNNISFPGSATPDALADAFRSADLFALPSISEGVPKVTQEAAACGLPVVCMNYFEAHSVVEGVNGFQARDESEFYLRIKNLIEDPDLRRRMGGASAEMAQSWGWGSLAKRWQDQIRTAALALPKKDFR
ncbi:glycosyltransferase (plasmid) [Sulfitobacter sp. W027]|uniref:glycosyltransferase family 4 protein n=1 Tax=Sulfitobacter sp. W027 TaxID=2867025 RepID=UPI0021A8BA2C|nr:glycosyltransferase [Sulfitobacter sp. W027]UWR35724.1 glycosyltransferase [Sulfitobacter sp. W027]